MSAVTDPSPTSRVAPSTARIPPKRLTTPSASRIGLPFDFPGAVPPSFTEHHLLALSEHALRAEGHQQDQDHADDEEAKGGDLGLRDRQLDEPRSLEQGPEDHAAD